MRPRATNLCPVCRKPLIAFRHPKVPTVALESCLLSEIHKALQPQPQPQFAPSEDPTVTKDLLIARGYCLPEFHPTNGILDQLLRGLAFIQSALALLFENPCLIAPILLNFTLVLILLVLWYLATVVFGLPSHGCDCQHD